MAVKDGLPSTDFSRMNREYIKAVAEEAAGGGGDLPEITDADIGKSLVVGSEPTTVFLIPEQTVNKEDDEGDIVYNPINTNKSAFTLGAEVTLYWNGENLGTSTVRYNSDLGFNYAQFVAPETEDNIYVEDMDEYLRINFQPDGGTAPDSAVVSLTGAGQKAVWSVDGGVVHISLVNGVLTMDRTFAEILSAVKVAPIHALFENESGTNVVFITNVYAMNPGGQVTVVMWTGNTFEQQVFIAMSDSAYPTAND